MNNHFNKLSKFLIYSILSPKDMKTRIVYLEQSLELLSELIKNNNFFSAFAVYLAITSPALSRLESLLHSKLENNFERNIK